ncbi:hypothetical protein J4E81_007788 [Alternaria sp. BMP 2799]|nr:hypothetical protein J4E81_007788 [Alternaria sp. BMP 2799]
MSSEEDKITSSLVNLDICMTAQESTVDRNSIPADEHANQNKTYRNQPSRPKGNEETEDGGMNSGIGLDEPVSDDDDDHERYIVDDDESVHLALNLKRHDWEPLRQIPDDKFKDIVLLSVDPSGQLERANVEILSRYEGEMNLVVTLQVRHKDQGDQDYVVSVPSVGTQPRWRAGDAHNLRNEVGLMKYLFQHTDVPAPEVIASAESVEGSNLGAPYILMKRLPGRRAHEIWFEDASDMSHITAVRISKETEVKRVNLLRSLANAMAGLQKVEFKGIGIPAFTDGGSSETPRVSYLSQWKDESDLTHEDLESDTQVYQYGPFASSIEYLTPNFRTIWPPLDSEVLDTLYPGTCDRLRALGYRKVLEIIFSQPVIRNSKASNAEASEEETFVLGNDLYLHNILVDDDGNVTGILDWSVFASPRFVGYASLPIFLRRDWHTCFTLHDYPCMGYQLDHYRQIYTKAMEETGCAEARFTAKSGMYHAIVEVLTSSMSAPELIKKIMLEIPELRRTDLNEFNMLLGRDDWPEAEEWLAGKIGELLDSKPLSR